MKKNCLFLTIATVALMGLSTSWAHAQEDDVTDLSDTALNWQNSRCYGHVIQVKANQHVPSRIYFRESSTSSRYYYGDTEDPVLINAALHSLNGPTFVRIYSQFGCGGGTYVGGIYSIRVNP